MAKDVIKEFEIKRVATPYSNGTAFLYSVSGRDGGVVSAEYVEKWRPEPGGRYIQFDDGTEFYTPPGASEEIERTPMAAPCDLDELTLRDYEELAKRLEGEAMEAAHKGEGVRAVSRNVMARRLWGSRHTEWLRLFEEAKANIDPV